MIGKRQVGWKRGWFKKGRLGQYLIDRNDRAIRHKHKVWGTVGQIGKVFRQIIGSDTPILERGVIK
jgi:hypothetical protein